MEQNIESATSNVKSTEQNTLSDTNSKKEHTILTPPVPNVIMLGLFFLATIGIIVFGYIHGDMHFAKVLETLKND
jgi:hypothetical protein